MFYDLMTQLLLPMGTALGLLVLALGLRRQKSWQEAAERSGFSQVETSWRLASPKLTARSGPVEIRFSEGRQSVYVVATIDGAPLDLAEVTIRRELLKLPGTREIEVGDEAFDSAFLVKGSRQFVSALLDAEVRQLLLAANREAGVYLAGGQLRIEVREDQLRRVLPLFRDLGRRFAERIDVIPRRLAENVRSDPEPGVRLHNLLLLVRDYPGYPGTEEALRIACEDASPQIRLQAALELGAEGRGTLLKLAEGLEDDTASARAVSTLGRELPLELLRSILGNAQPRYFAKTTDACLEALSSHGGAAVETLAEVMANNSFAQAVAAAHALGATGHPAAEAPLLIALARDESPEFQKAAVEALGRVGSASAVLPLQEAAERSAGLRRVSREAIAEIQARLAGASPGQLSLAAVDAGQLSLATEGGELSLAPHPTGQLSRAPHPAGQVPPQTQKAG